MLGRLAPLGSASPTPLETVGQGSDDSIPSDASEPTEAEHLPDLQHLAQSDLKRLSVARLRQLVRRTPGAQMQGRQISRANKEELVTELLAAASRRA